MLFILMIAIVSAELDCSTNPSWTISARIVKPSELVVIKCEANRSAEHPILNFESSLNLTVNDHVYERGSTSRKAYFRAPADAYESFKLQKTVIKCSTPARAPCFFSLFFEFEPFIDQGVPKYYNPSSLVECPIRAMPFKYKLQWNNQSEIDYSNSSMFFSSRKAQHVVCRLFLKKKLVLESYIYVSTQNALAQKPNYFLVTFLLMSLILFSFIVVVHVVFFLFKTRIASLFSLNFY